MPLSVFTIGDCVNFELCPSPWGRLLTKLLPNIFLSFTLQLSQINNYLNLSIQFLRKYMTAYTIWCQKHQHSQLMGRNENTVFSPFFCIVIVTTMFILHPGPLLFIRLAFNNCKPLVGYICKQCNIYVTNIPVESSGNGPEAGVTPLRHIYWTYFYWSAFI